MRFLLISLLLVATDATDSATPVAAENLPQLSDDWNEQAGAQQGFLGLNSSEASDLQSPPKRNFTSPHLTEDGHPHASIGAYVSTALRQYQLVQTEVEHAQRLVTSSNIELGDRFLPGMGDAFKAVADAAKKVADAAKFAIQVMKMIIEMVDEGWKSTMCVIDKAPTSILDNFGDLIGDPAKFFEEWSKKLEAFIPKLIDETQGTVDSSLSLLDGIFSGEAVDIKPLQLSQLIELLFDPSLVE